MKCSEHSLGDAPTAIRIFQRGPKKIRKIWHMLNRAFRKVRKPQHHNPEFGHTSGEIFKKTAKKYMSIQRGMKLRKPSILVVS
jgi:hypothetical protein